MSTPDTREGYSRRSMLAGAAGLTGVVAMAGGGWRSPTASAAPAGDATPTAGGGTTGYLDLTLGRNGAAFPLSAAGGDLVGEVITDPPGEDGIEKKHIGAVTQEDIVVTVGSAISRPLHSWINELLGRRQTPRSGAIAGSHISTDNIDTLRFEDAVLSEIEFPGCDAASASTSKMTLKLSPATTRYESSGGTLRPPKAGKAWRTAFFRLDIDGLDTNLISKVDAITVKQLSPAPAARGGVLAPASGIEISNLKLELGGSLSPAWSTWFDDFVAGGNNGDEFERSATLTYLFQDATPFFSLRFSNVGIFDFTVPRFVRAGEPLPPTRVELYAETVVATF
jgi:hypothetical protein